LELTDLQLRMIWQEWSL